MRVGVQTTNLCMDNKMQNEKKQQRIAELLMNSTMGNKVKYNIETTKNDWFNDIHTKDSRILLTIEHKEMIPNILIMTRMIQSALSHRMFVEKLTYCVKMIFHIYKENSFWVNAHIE